MFGVPNTSHIGFAVLWRVDRVSCFAWYAVRMIDPNRSTTSTLPDTIEDDVVTVYGGLICFGDGDVDVDVTEGAVS